MTALRRDLLTMSAGVTGALLARRAVGADFNVKNASWPAPDEARTIAREAYFYAYPMVENYNSIYQFALDPSGGQYKGPPNAVHSVARVFGPQDTGVVTPNSDTPYSFLIMDLRTEPLVVTMPAIEPSRYYSLQLVDLYTHNFDYFGTRLDGNGGGDFLVAGPDWRGDPPRGIKRLVRSETQLVFSQFRTQLVNAADIENVKRIQSGYKARPLSAYLGQSSPTPSPSIACPPISRETIDPRLFAYANFLLRFCPVLPSESAMRDRFARIGVRPGAPWPPRAMPVALRGAVQQGEADGRRAVTDAAQRATTSKGLFGTREEMAGRYLERAVGAKLGLYGNNVEEALYPAYQTGDSGQPLDAGRFDYAMTFTPGELPPVDAFWSVTMYDGRTRYLVANPLDRYLINTAMLPGLTRGQDGSLTLYLQHRSPGTDKESNWLPAPDGPMFVVMRLYLPQQAAITGTWTPPPLRRIAEAGR